MSYSKAHRQKSVTGNVKNEYLEPLVEDPQTSNRRIYEVTRISRQSIPIDYGLFSDES